MTLIGLTRAARAAGTKLAAMPTTTITTAAAAYVPADRADT
jgi:hypothetical protein